MPESTAPPRLRIPGAPLTFEPHAFRRPRPNGHKRPPSGQRFHLWVSGCQMNESDADYLSQGLTAAGFSAVADLDQADLAILVTCSVRQNAEQKAYGRFRELKAWKRARPGRAIAMTGCMANKEKDRLYERLPDLDYRFDMRQYEAFIEDLQGEYETDPAQTGGVVLQHGLTAYVPVIFGCNEVCSFCIVPFVRGTERSRPLDDLVEDVRRFARQGVREVTLLGQTINSYRDPESGARLADLLEAVEGVPGIWRVRFLTSHPRHVHDDLLFAIRDLPRVCEHLHLPFQSGDDAILKQMRRRYTVDEYRAIIAHARNVIADLSVSTDVIVGYPGETEEQFQRTLALLEEIKFDVVHIQGFSPRPRTTAARQADDVAPAEPGGDRGRAPGRAGRHRPSSVHRTRHRLATSRPGPQLGEPLKPVPVLEQYEAVKREHPDAIVLFRLGDFYETFGDDAERAAPLLGITLTSRELGKGQRYPMAGVPYHAYESYVGKLLRAGLKVALCDQVETAGEAHGLVRREVVRVLTPGTVVEDAYLEGGGTNYAVAVCLRSPYHGIAALDCSTGELALLRVEPTDDALRDELTRLRPAELVASEGDRSRLLTLVGATPISWADPLDFDARAAVDRLQTLLGVETLAAFGCDEWPEALAAAHAILRHAERSRLRLEPGLLRLHAEHPRAFMHLDPPTRRSLGLNADRPSSGDDLVGMMLREATTTMGARELRRWLDQPLRDRAPLDDRLARVALQVEDPLARGQLQTALRGLPDLERIAARTGQGVATPRDLRGLLRALVALPGVRRTTAKWPGLAGALPSPSEAELRDHLERALVDDVPATLKDGGVFKPGFDV